MKLLRRPIMKLLSVSTPCSRASSSRGCSRTRACFSHAPRKQPKFSAPERCLRIPDQTACCVGVLTPGIFVLTPPIFVLTQMTAMPVVTAESAERETTEAKRLVFARQADKLIQICQLDVMKHDKMSLRLKDSMSRIAWPPGVSRRKLTHDARQMHVSFMPKHAALPQTVCVCVYRLPQCAAGCCRV